MSAEQPEWRPIATAPKDGTMILVSWDYGILAGSVMEVRFEDGWCNKAGAPYSRMEPLGISDPTHWFPKPVLPPHPQRH